MREAHSFSIHPGKQMLPGKGFLQLFPTGPARAALRSAALDPPPGFKPSQDRPPHGHHETAVRPPNHAEPHFPLENPKAVGFLHHLLLRWLQSKLHDGATVSPGWATLLSPAHTHFHGQGFPLEPAVVAASIRVLVAVHLLRGARGHGGVVLVVPGVAAGHGVVLGDIAVRGARGLKAAGGQRG